VHELSIAAAVVATVADAAGGARVECVRIRVGALSAVVPGPLHFAWEVATEGTCCAGSTLQIDELPVTVWCEDCQATGALTPPLRFRCSRCGVPTPDIRGGRELDIVSYTLAGLVEV
jgi:hydrogenase nickel incorporation protein HypA/HybF